jgi:hypothetical protein
MFGNTHQVANASAHGVREAHTSQTSRYGLADPASRQSGATDQKEGKSLPGDVQLPRPEPQQHHPPDPLPRSDHPHRQNAPNRRCRPAGPFDATSNFVQLIADTVTSEQRRTTG